MKKIDYKNYTKPTDYLSFPIGRTTIRIVSQGLLIRKHGMQMGNAYIPLGDCTEDETCKHCADGNEAKLRYVWLAYDRKGVGILSVGPQAGDQICLIAKDHGDPQGYDLFITRVGLGKKTKYTVEKSSSRTFRPEEVELINKMKPYLAQRIFKSKTKE